MMLLVGLFAGLLLGVMVMAAVSAGAYDRGCVAATELMLAKLKKSSPKSL